MYIEPNLGRKIYVVDVFEEAKRICGRLAVSVSGPNHRYVRRLLHAPSLLALPFGIEDLLV